MFKHEFHNLYSKKGEHILQLIFNTNERSRESIKSAYLGFLNDIEKEKFNYFKIVAADERFFHYYEYWKIKVLRFWEFKTPILQYFYKRFKKQPFDILKSLIKIYRLFFLNLPIYFQNKRNEFDDNEWIYKKYNIKYFGISSNNHTVYNKFQK